MGLDVAMRNTGVFVFDTQRMTAQAASVISTEKHSDGFVIEHNVKCVRKLVKAIDALFLHYQPSHVFAELPTGGSKSSRAATMMSLAIGGVVGLCAARGIVLVNVRPSEVKQLVRVKGPVDKKEVQRVVIKVFGEIAGHIQPLSKREHAYDAAGAFLAAHP